MTVRKVPNPVQFRATLLAVIAVVLGGCFAGYWTYGSAGGGTGYAADEERLVGYPAHDAFVITQDVLRGEGVLFGVKPENKIVTLWKPADTPAGMWASLVGVHPRYRYEIEVAPQSGHQSKIIAKVRAEDIADNEIGSYKASKRLDLFNQFDQLAAKFPPPPTTPTSGGVNFVLLPGEDLRGLSKRVTGEPENWRRIAEDNGLKSATDVTGVQSVWVSTALLQPAKKATEPPSGGHE